MTLYSIYRGDFRFNHGLIKGPLCLGKVGTLPAFSGTSRFRFRDPPAVKKKHVSDVSYRGPFLHINDRMPWPGISVFFLGDWSWEGDVNMNNWAISSAKSGTIKT